MRSLIGSCVDMSDPPYQLDFTSPGTRPLEPSSRSALRESLFLAIDRARTPGHLAPIADPGADELRGISASFKVCRKPFFHRLGLVGDDGLQLRAPFGAAFFGHPLAPVCFFSIELFFAMLGSWVSAFERLLSASHCRNGKLNAVNKALLRRRCARW